MTTDPDLDPWYRHRWPWFLMSGPAIVVVAGIATAIIAVRTSDGLVAEDYYKQGLAINRVLGREERAQALGVRARVQFNEARDAVRVQLEAPSPAPAALRLWLLHPTRAGEDQAVALRAVAPGLYEGSLMAPRAGAWRIRVEDGSATWRISGGWQSQRPGVTLDAVAR